MIKRCVSIILVGIMIMTLNVSVIARSAEGATKQSRKLPTIELKDAKLRGTAISGVFKPIAIVEHSGKNYWYKVGDTLCGRRIVDIKRGSVTLELNGRLCLFGLPQGAIGNLDAVSYEGRPDLAIGEKIGENTWKVTLDEAIEALTRVGALMKEARIRPYFAIGKAAGVRIDRIKDGSVINQMGFTDGDIVKGVNGFGLMSPTKVFEAYRRYKNNRLVEVQLLRNDEPVTLTYNITR